MEALEEQVRLLRQLNIISKNDNFPTHISQYSNALHRKMFDMFGLTGEVAKKNNKTYVEAIKRLRWPVK